MLPAPDKMPDRQLAATLIALGISVGFSALPLVHAAAPGQKASAPAAGAARPLTARRPMPTRRLPGAKTQEDEARPGIARPGETRPLADQKPRQQSLQKSGSSLGDVRSLPSTVIRRRERPEHDGPDPSPVLLPGTAGQGEPQVPTRSVAESAAPAPTPTVSFDGLDYDTWGSGHPPDTNGDVGPNHYIQTINSSVGIYSKTGTQLAAFTLDALMSQGGFGNLCDTDNQGDPVVLYDTFEDRWVITDFAFQLNGDGSIANPPGAFQCFAFSKTGDPVSGGWNFYSIQLTDALNDYPKLGVWPDGIYMSANLFDFTAAGNYMGTRVWAVNKEQAYAGAPAVQVVTFDGPAYDFTLIPSNARLQTGTPISRPNYFVSTWGYTNAVSVYQFQVYWRSPTLSTFTGPSHSVASSSWPSAGVALAPSLGGNSLDTLGIRAMVQNQFTRIGREDSLWVSHTVRRGDTTGFAAPRWYQIEVVYTLVAASPSQAATWDPDGANVMHRFMPSLAVNRNGDMAMGYSTSSSTTKPAIKYAGRLATDPVNTFSQTETTLIQGAGTQTGTSRWGDYSAMTLDPDGCRFWYTNMYYAADGLNHKTRIGAFQFPGCTPLSDGTLTGQVTSWEGAAPLAGAKVSLGSRTTYTDASGVFTFSLPAGTYPSPLVSLPGYYPDGTGAFTLPSGGTVNVRASLSPAPTSLCLSDISQSDLQGGEVDGCTLTRSAGDVALADTIPVNQHNGTVTNSAYSFNKTAWVAQVFQPSVSGTITRVDLDLFCYLCPRYPEEVQVSIRATAGSPATPTGFDLGLTEIRGVSSGSGGYYSANFSTPVPVTAGTKYAIVIRSVLNLSSGTHAFVCSCTTPDSNPYPSGSLVWSSDSGASWLADTVAGGRDLGFKVHVRTGFTSSGTYISSLKDANPATGLTPNWGTISWTATTPANTGVTFQAGASDSEYGPFTFVGPDGTSGTSFGNGASLARFNGRRYLKYRATLTTSNSGATPLLQDVTVCYENKPAASPEIYFFGASNVVVNAGSSPVLSWSASPGAALTLNGSPVGGPTGSTTVNPSVTTTYTLVATSGGTASRQVTVTVNDGSAGLGTPTVIAPTAAQTVVVKGVGVSWSAVGGAAGYDLRVFDYASGATLFSGSLLGNGSTSALVNLEAGTYHFGVRACSGGFDAAHCGRFGLQTFTVFPASPSGAPMVTFPTPGASLVTSTQTLRWTEVTPNPLLPTMSYEVLLRNITAGTTTLQITVPSPTRSTIFTMGSSTHYELKVRACQAGCGPWSTPVSFSVTLPSVPASAPTIGSCSVSGGNSLSCNWGAVSHADTYQVLVVQPTGGPGGSALTVAAVQVSATSFTLPVPSGSATVLIGACNGDGCGPNAQAPITAGGPNPSAPNLGTPMAGTVVNGPTVLFTWNRIPTDVGATTYRLYVQDLSRQSAALDVYTTQNFYAAYFKAEGARYDALVIANPGVSQIAGPASGFNVAGASATSPTMVAPAHNSTVSSGNIQLGWSPVPGATLYEYFVAVQGAPDATVRGVTTGLLAQVPLTGTGGGTVYSGIVRACPAGLVCAAGSETNWGPWSNLGGPGVTNFTVVP